MERAGNRECASYSSGEHVIENDEFAKEVDMTQRCVCAARDLDDNCAQLTSESANSERPVWRSKHELRALASI